MPQTTPAPRPAPDRHRWAARVELACRAVRSSVDDPLDRAELLAAVNDLLRLAVERDQLGWRRAWRRTAARQRALLDERAEQLVDVLCELSAGPGRPLPG